ncbi:hypothetical protein OJAV_G00234550 [Oryzias javanicus]|uniref:CD99 antigen-like protein 2 n=1 Tax=Oryzias javanicus TaxID=123683 RepID=A0A437BYX1_ORYJA|nr:hypothetical protein OJAV_G00234550 [Oryzias javanicus]
MDEGGACRSIRFCWTFSLTRAGFCCRGRFRTDRGIVSAIGVALAGAASSYFAYQKKKLCFKLQGGTDPESGKGHAGTQAEPQVLSNLLQSN